MRPKYRVSETLPLPLSFSSTPVLSFSPCRTIKNREMTMPIRLFWKFTLSPYYRGKVIVLFSKSSPQAFSPFCFHFLVLLSCFACACSFCDFDFCIPVVKCHLTDTSTKPNRITSLFDVLRDPSPRILSEA